MSQYVKTFKSLKEQITIIFRRWRFQCVHILDGIALCTKRCLVVCEQRRARKAVKIHVEFYSFLCILLVEIIRNCEGTEQLQSFKIKGRS